MSSGAHAYPPVSPDGKAGWRVAGGEGSGDGRRGRDESGGESGGEGASGGGEGHAVAAALREVRSELDFVLNLVGNYGSGDGQGETVEDRLAALAAAAETAAEERRAERARLALLETRLAAAERRLEAETAAGQSAAAGRAKAVEERLREHAHQMELLVVAAEDAARARAKETERRVDEHVQELNRRVVTFGVDAERRQEAWQDEGRGMWDGMARDIAMQVDALESTVAVCAEQCAEMDRRTREADARLEDAESLGRQLAALRTQTERDGDDRSALQRAMERHTVRLEDLETAIAAADDNTTAAKERVDAAMAAVDALQETVGDLGEYQLASLRAQLDAAKDSVAAIEDDVDEIRLDVEERFRGMNNDVAALRNAVHQRERPFGGSSRASVADCDASSVASAATTSAGDIVSRLAVLEESVDQMKQDVMDGTDQWSTAEETLVSLKKVLDLTREDVAAVTGRVSTSEDLAQMAKLGVEQSRAAQKDVAALQQLVYDMDVPASLTAVKGHVTTLEARFDNLLVANGADAVETRLGALETAREQTERSLNRLRTVEAQVAAMVTKQGKTAGGAPATPGKSSLSRTESDDIVRRIELIMQGEEDSKAHLIDLERRMQALAGQTKRTRADWEEERDSTRLHLDALKKGIQAESEQARHAVGQVDRRLASLEAIVDEHAHQVASVRTDLLHVTPQSPGSLDSSSLRNSVLDDRLGMLTDRLDGVETHVSRLMQAHVAAPEHGSPPASSPSVQVVDSRVGALEAQASRWLETLSTLAERVHGLEATVTETAAAVALPSVPSGEADEELRAAIDDLRASHAELQSVVRVLDERVSLLQERLSRSASPSRPPPSPGKTDVQRSVVDRLLRVEQHMGKLDQFLDASRRHHEEQMQKAYHERAQREIAARIRNERVPQIQAVWAAADGEPSGSDSSVSETPVAAVPSDASITSMVSLSASVPSWPTTESTPHFHQPAMSPPANAVVSSVALSPEYPTRRVASPTPASDASVAWSSMKAPHPLHDTSTDSIASNASGVVVSYGEPVIFRE